MSVTNLDFIKVGGVYPPVSDVPLLAKYNRYDTLFEGRVADAYLNKLRLPNPNNNDLVGGMKALFANPKITNYARAITKKTVDLMLSRQPRLLGTTTAIDNELIELQRDTQCWKQVRRGFTDVSRYGDGYIREYNKVPRMVNGKGELTEGEARCNVINSKLVTIVVNPMDKEDITNYVIGWVDDVDDNDPQTAGRGDAITVANKEYYLTLEIHSKGYYELKRFKCANPIFNMGQIKQYTLEADVTPAEYKGKQIPTGLDGFAIKHLTGFTTSDNPLYGQSDYDMFDSLMLELCERLSGLAEVFEKHGNPSMQGSDKLISQDDNGNPVFYTGDYYPLANGDQRLEYLTWDAKSKEILEYCDKLLQQIFILTEMGDGSIMGYSTGKDGFAESGKGLRLKMASPLMKTQSLIFDNNDEIISMFVDFAKIKGYNIKASDIEITWQDGLPIDMVEETNMFNARVQAGTESIMYGLQRRFGMTPAQAKDEYDTIIREKKEATEAMMKQQQNNNLKEQTQSDTREQTENTADAENAGTSSTI